MKEFTLSGAAGKALKIDYQNELNEEQLDVVLHGDGPCLVLAGAGSGKTRTITYRVAYLLEQGIRPEEILLLTFTNKASREMLERVESLLGGEATGLWGGTFHSIANRILRQYAPLIGRTSSFNILDEEDAKDLIKLCVKELDIDPTERRFPSPAVLKSIISFSRNAGCTVRDAVMRKYPQFGELMPSIERIAELYDARKTAADVTDFDDLLFLLRRLLRERPDVRDRLASQFRYVLVDEYQDTNSLQADVVRDLSSAHGNVLVVGDDAQSIYSFRAADVKNILSFPDAFPDTKVFRLVTNYRSSPEILSFANEVIRHNEAQFKKTLRAVNPGFELPNLVPASTDAEEARFIAERVLALREEGVAMEDVAVLFRASFHSQALEFELMKRDIPYEYRGGMKFFERAHVKDIVAHLRLMANPKDEAAWMRTLSLQAGVGITTAGKIMDAFRGAETIQAALDANMPGSGRAKKAWEALVKELYAMLDSGRPGDMIRSVAGGGYRDYLEAEYPDFRDRLQDLEQFALFADAYDDLRKFLDEVSLTDQYGAKRQGSESSDDERIVLSTIHQAKGLEWDAVFVMGLSDGKFPNPRALEEDGGLEEERRLMYVAVTRARKHLFLTYPVASLTDSLAIGAPSQFIHELPDGLVEQVRLRYAPRPSAYRRVSWDDGGEPTIVLDDLGEKKPEAPYRGLLRNVDEL